MSRETKLVTLARKMMLTVDQTMALPATIEVAAKSVGFTEDEMIAEAMNNGGVCQYLASVCRKVAA